MRFLGSIPVIENPRGFFLAARQVADFHALGCDEDADFCLAAVFHGAFDGLFVGIPARFKKDGNDVLAVQVVDHHLIFA